MGTKDAAARVARLQHYATHGSYHSTEVALQHDLKQLLAALAAAEARATRLAALEQAARALMDCTGGIVCQWGTVGMGAWRDLQEALANLAAPPGEGM